MQNLRAEPIIGCYYSPKNTSPTTVLYVDGLHTYRDAEGVRCFTVELLDPSEVGTNAEPLLMTGNQWIEHGFILQKHDIQAKQP